MSRPRAIFFGSPAFAVPTLDALASIADVVRVVSQPDRPAGRGLGLQPPAVKVRALELGLSVMQPSKVRTEEFAAELRGLDADVGVVVAYGRILTRAVLDAPRKGCVNVHASLLPRYRGAAPIQWAIARGERETGVCLMQMDEGLDTGPVYSCATTAIGDTETAGELSERLARLGADLLQRDLPRVLAGELHPKPQVDSESTYAPLLEKEDGRIDWSNSAVVIEQRIRGMTPWPGAFTTFGSDVIKIHRAHVGAREGRVGAPGTVVRASDGVLEVAAGEGSIRVDALQLPGKRRLTTAEFLAGRGFSLGTRFDLSASGHEGNAT